MTSSKVIHKAYLLLRKLLGETLSGEGRKTFSIRFLKLLAQPVQGEVS